MHAAMPSEVAQPKGMSHGTQPANPSSRHCHPTAPLSHPPLAPPVHILEPKLAQALLPQLKQVGQAQLAVRARLLPGGEVRVGAGGELALQQGQD